MNTAGDSRESQNPSIVRFIGPGDETKCGYCKKKGARSHWMLADRLLHQDYKRLLDRGWRRSGKSLYRPTNNNTCCPAYTISCDALNFKLSRSQKRCIDQVNRFLLYDERPGGSKLKDESPRNEQPVDSKRNAPEIHRDLQHKMHTVVAKKTPFLQRDLRFYEDSSKMKHKRLYHRLLKLMNSREGISISKASEIIVERSERRRSSKNVKSLEGRLYPEEPTNPKHTLELKLHKTSLTESYCKTYHKAELEVLQKYQKEIHKEEKRSWQFKNYSNFLIESPLVVEPIQIGNESKPKVELSRTAICAPELPKEYGSYHCCYWLDKTKLIAVGVIDIIENCISSVYFYYDPEYGFLRLGVYSALREIELLRRYSATINRSLAQYYMGFYIPTCPKMSYKIGFKPSSLLCNESGVFVDTAICEALLKSNNLKYVRFNTAQKDLDIFKCDTLDSQLLDQTRVFIHPHGQTMPLRMSIELISSEMFKFYYRRGIKEYVRLVSPALARRMVVDFRYMVMPRYD